MIGQYRRQSTVDAPQLSVRPQVPHSRRWLFTLLLAVILLMIGWYSYQQGFERGGYDEGAVRERIEQLEQDNQKLVKQHERMIKQLVQLQQQLTIAQANVTAAQQQINVLTEEKMRLMEDLAFFQNLTAGSENPEIPALHRLQVKRGAVPGEYLFSALLVRSGKRIDMFHGSYQLVLTLQSDGAETVRVVSSEQGDRFPLKFKYYQRLSRQVQLHPHEVLKQAQLRVYKKNADEVLVVEDVAFEAAADTN